MSDWIFGFVTGISVTLIVLSVYAIRTQRRQR